MQTIIALLFCVALSVMVMAQGWSALLWVSLGFFVGLFVTARIALPILLGLPRAIRLVTSGEMRAAVYRRLLLAPALWIVQLAVIVVLLRFFWPSATAWFEGNGALSAGLWLGVIAILLSALSKRSRGDFHADFDRSYRRFYVHRTASKTSCVYLPEHEAIAKLVKSAENRKQNRQLSDFFTGSETLGAMVP